MPVKGKNETNILKLLKKVAARKNEQTTFFSPSVILLNQTLYEVTVL
jgi:hypothetical protein